MFHENRLVHRFETQEVPGSAPSSVPEVDPLKKAEDLINFAEANLEKNADPRSAELKKKLGEGILKFLGNLPELKTQFTQKEISEAMIADGKSFYLLLNMTEFPELDHRETALRIIEAKQGLALAGGMEHLKVDHGEMAQRLIDTNQIRAIRVYRDHFKLPAQELDSMIQKGEKAQKKAEEKRVQQLREKADKAYDREWEKQKPVRESQIKERSEKRKSKLPYQE